jgi:HAL2 family 3'(2'),5'-bisphosphate nucleotidase
MDHDVALQAATRAACLGAELCRRLGAAGVSLAGTVKPDQSPVTVADLASQAVITWALLETLGQHLGQSDLVGEEDPVWLAKAEHTHLIELALEAARGVLPHLDAAQLLELLGRSTARTGLGRYWLVDPLDGTKGYLGGGQYAVAVALVEDGAPILGVLACPRLGLGRFLGDSEIDVPDLDPTGSLYVAQIGRGVSQAACPLDTVVSASSLIPRSRPSGVPLRLATSRDPSHGDGAALDRVRQALGESSILVRVDSAAKYALVARGDVDAFIRLAPPGGTLEYAWDHAAGVLIAREAGVQVTDASGMALDFGDGRSLGVLPGVVAARPVIHRRLVAAVEEVRGCL